MRLLKTIGSVEFTGQERAALNNLTMPVRGFMDRGCSAFRGSTEFGSHGRVHAVRSRVVHREVVEGAVDPLPAPEEIAVHSGPAAGRSEPPRGRLAMKSSTSCSTHRTARLPMRIGFGKRDSAISA